MNHAAGYSWGHRSRAVPDNSDFSLEIENITHAKIINNARSTEGPNRDIESSPTGH